MTAFPVLQQSVSEYGWIVIGMSFVIFSALRFLAAYNWNPATTMSLCFATLVALYWFLLYIRIFRSRPHSILLACIIPTCIVCMLLPGMGYIWSKVKPEPIVSLRGRFERDRRSRPRPLPRPKAAGEEVEETPPLQTPRA